MLNDHMKTAGHQLNAKKSFKQAKLPFGKSSSSSSSDVSPTTSVTVPESPSEPLFVDVSNNTSNTSTSAQTPPTAASSSSSSSCLPSWPSVSSVPSSASTMTGFLIDEKVLDGEILMMLYCVEKNLPFYAMDEAGDLFQRIFSDSQIARKFKARKDKLRYMLVYGAYPTFEGLLKERVDETRDLVLLFDETHNSDLKLKQIPI